MPSLLQGFLQRDARLREGVCVEGVQDTRRHLWAQAQEQRSAFFADLNDWPTLILM
jgi:hypothetical protein